MKPDESKKVPLIEIPQYLEEIASCTPAGVHALIESWDGLSTESHILLLKNLELQVVQTSYDREAHVIFKTLEGQRWINKIYEKAILSANAYVRYLSARFYRYHSEISGRGTAWEQSLAPDEKSFYDRVQNDKSPLVRFVYCKWNSKENFWDLPHEARLSVACRGFWSPSDIIKIIKDALEQKIFGNAVSDFELYQILAGVISERFINDYTGRSKDSHSYYAEKEDIERGKNMEALWALVPQLPISSAQLLANRLPTASGEFVGIGEVIKEDFYEKLPEEIQKTILYRKDFALPHWTLDRTYRKKIFFNSTNDELRRAAASCNLDITYDEFDKILKLPIAELRSLCTMLWGDGSDVISLPVYTFMHCIVDYHYRDWKYLEEKLRRSYTRYKELVGFFGNPKRSEKGGHWSYDNALKPIEDFLLLLLAFKAVRYSLTEEDFSKTSENASYCFRDTFCGNSNISRYAAYESVLEGYKPVLEGKLAFLKAGIVEKNVWETFCNFSALWHKSSGGTCVMQIESPHHGTAMQLIGNVSEFEELLPKEESNDANTDSAKISKIFSQKEKMENRVEISIAIAFWIFSGCFLIYGNSFWAFLAGFAGLSMIRSAMDYDFLRVTKAFEAISKKVEKLANR